MSRDPACHHYPEEKKNLVKTHNLSNYEDRNKMFNVCPNMPGLRSISRRCVSFFGPKNCHLKAEVSLRGFTDFTLALVT